MNILEGLIPGEDAPKQVDASHLEKLFVFSLMWSVGALLELEDRKKVNCNEVLELGVTIFVSDSLFSSYIFSTML